LAKQRVALCRPFVFREAAMNPLPARANRAAAVIAAPFGSLRLEANGEFLLGITPQTATAGLIEPATPLLQEAARQLDAYFQDPRQPFSLPLPTVGTPYQQSVWRALRAIPPGRTKSYGQIAKELASAPRAVAGACRANHFPIIIPCHRVVASHGLGGYCGAVAGPSIDIKRWLLRHEGYELP
jgi:methylated-DNA-[protein]-cysteine S-methyltransferase